MKTTILVALTAVAMVVALPAEDGWRAADEGLDTVVAESDTVRARVAKDTLTMTQTDLELTASNHTSAAQKQLNKMNKQAETAAASTHNALAKVLEKAESANDQEKKEIKNKRVVERHEKKLENHLDPAIAERSMFKKMMDGVARNYTAEYGWGSKAYLDHQRKKEKQMINDPSKETRKDDRRSVASLGRVLRSALKFRKWYGAEQYNHDPYNHDAGGKPHTMGTGHGGKEAAGDNGYGYGLADGHRRHIPEYDHHGDRIVIHKHTKRWPWIGYNKFHTQRAIKAAKLAAKCRRWAHKITVDQVLKRMNDPIRFKRHRCTLRDKRSKRSLRQMARVIRRYPYLAIQVQAGTASKKGQCKTCKGCKNQRGKPISSKALAECRSGVAQWYLKTYRAPNNMTTVAKPCSGSATATVIAMDGEIPKVCVKLQEVWKKYKITYRTEAKRLEAAKRAKKLKKLEASKVAVGSAIGSASSFMGVSPLN